MNREPQALPPPSLGRLARTTAIAVIVASAILVTLVLPAEYGLDPLGTGRRLGLTDIAAPETAPASAIPAGAPMVPIQRGPIGEYPRDFAVDVFDFVLGPYEYIEYKYQLERGATMLYAWRADHEVDHDFHGERAGDGANGPAEESFDRRMRRASTGVYTAPFSGIHGWYWENPGADPVTVHLSSAGFYTSATEIHSNRKRYAHALRPLDAMVPAPFGASEPTGR